MIHQHANNNTRRIMASRRMLKKVKTRNTTTKDTPSSTDSQTATKAIERRRIHPTHEETDSLAQTMKAISDERSWL